MSTHVPGERVLATIAEIAPAVPVVVLSGLVGSRELAGAAAVLQKPVRLDDLDAVLARLLAR